MLIINHVNIHQRERSDILKKEEKERKKKYRIVLFFVVLHICMLSLSRSMTLDELLLASNRILF